MHRPFGTSAGASATHQPYSDQWWDPAGRHGGGTTPASSAPGRDLIFGSGCGFDTFDVGAQQVNPLQLRPDGSGRWMAASIRADPTGYWWQVPIVGPQEEGCLYPHGVEPLVWSFLEDACLFRIGIFPSWTMAKRWLSALFVAV